VKYETIAEAYRDLEQVSGRLALIERMTALLAETPAELLPVVCYLCQGLIAPEFAGVDLGLAEKMAIRAVAAATGTEPAQVAARVREIGDLGLTAEQLLAATAAGQPASLTVTTVVNTLRQIANAEGTGSQGRKLDLLAGLLGQATPLEARYLLRLVTGGLRLGVGTPTILDALAQVYAGGRAFRPVLERAYNICSDLGQVAAAVASGGLAAVEQIKVHPGNPVRAMAAQRLSDAAQILAKLGGECAAEYKYDGVRVQAHRTADGTIELFTRRLEEVSTQFPDVVELLAAGLGPREAIIEGEVVAYDAATGELHPFQEVMFRRRKYGIAEAVRDVPVGMFCFELLYADGRDLTNLPYPQRRAALAEAITLSPQLRLTTAIEVSTPEALDAAFEQAVTDGCEGLMCKSVGPASIYQAGARGWLWIKLKRDYRTELSDTADLVVVGAYAGRGRRAGVYGAVLLAAYDPDADVFRTVTKCGAGFTDADLAALPVRLAPLASAHKPARVDARQDPDVWFEPGLVLEILSAELTLSPNYTAGWGAIKDDAGLAMRFPRFTGRWRDDKSAEDATTVTELVDLFRTARRTPAGGLAWGWPASGTGQERRDGRGGALPPLAGTDPRRRRGRRRAASRRAHGVHARPVRGPYLRHPRGRDALCRGDRLPRRGDQARRTGRRRTARRAGLRRLLARRAPGPEAGADAAGRAGRAAVLFVRPGLGVRLGLARRGAGADTRDGRRSDLRGRGRHRRRPRDRRAGQGRRTVPLPRRPALLCRQLAAVLRRRRDRAADPAGARLPPRALGAHRS
jgi:DNA ligase-1